MKQLILLVGPMGSGKSTYAHSFNKHFSIISQDQMGDTGHKSIFLDCLKAGKNVIVDRCNFTRNQRKFYIDLAKSYGYHTLIQEFYEPYKVCYNRIVNRQNHPTIPAEDKVTARKALDMYFSQYEVVTKDEADSVGVTDCNPMIHELPPHFSPAYGKARVFVVGDIHGCYDDLQNLKEKVGFRQGIDVLVSVGDLVDRGPKIDQVLHDFNYETTYYKVIGNHCNKFIRWLKGNKVNTKSLEQSIEQFEKTTLLPEKEEFYLDMVDTPYIIKYGKNLITHAGFFPENPLKTSREFCLYARKYDPAIKTFTNNDTAPYWYEFYPEDAEYNLFFGHEIHEEISQVRKNVFALDGGCYAGGKLRMAEINLDGLVAMHEVNSSMPKVNEDKEWDHMNKFEPYDKLVEQKLLNKQESGDLVLYNYTDHCTYSKHWNKYTMECRGLILNKVTGETVARPFQKFFNLFENDSYRKLPDEPYEVYEKVDGSLGILYKDPADNKWKIATRGSFTSPQALKATEMFHYSVVNDCSPAQQLEKLKQYHDYTLLFEIIYPENRVNPGARLVCDYGSKEILVLLGAIHKVTGKDIHYWDLEILSEELNLPLAKKYNYTIDEMIALQKTLPATEEGFVVKYSSGFRVKIKGDEYCKMARILNSITPLFIWEEMTQNDTFSLPEKYKVVVPEEIIDEVNEIEKKLQEKYSNILNSLYNEYCSVRLKFGGSENFERELGLYCKVAKHPRLLFLLHSGKHKQLQQVIANEIRPRGNVIE